MDGERDMDDERDSGRGNEGDTLQEWSMQSPLLFFLVEILEFAGRER